jgi:hypothetical protein
MGRTVAGSAGGLVLWRRQCDDIGQALQEQLQLVSVQPFVAQAASKKLPNLDDALLDVAVASARELWTGTT